MTVEKPSVSWHKDSVSPGLPNELNVKYSYNNLTVAKPTAETASYQLHNLTVTPTGNKSVSMEIDGTDQNVNGKTITKGDIEKYSIPTRALVANRTDNLASHVIVDKLPDGVVFKDYTAILNGRDVTSDYTVVYDAKNNTVKASLKTNSDLVKQANSNKGLDFALPVLNLVTVVAKDGTHLENKANIYVNGIEYDTNVVNTNVDNPKPSKGETVAGQDSNGKTIIPGDIVKYTVNWDLTKLANFAISDLQDDKGMSLVDDYDANTVANQSSLTLLDKNGKAVNGVTFAWDTANTKLVATVSNPRTFLSQYGGQALKLSFDAQAKNAFSGNIKNQAVQINFGNKYETNTVTNKVEIPKPSKDVVANAGDSISINGDKVKMGDYIDYVLHSKKLPANRATSFDKEVLSDSIDTTHDSVTNRYLVVNDQDWILADGTTLKKGTDIGAMGLVQYNYKQGTVTLTTTDKYKALANSNANKNHAMSFTGYVTVKRIAAGFVYNKFDDVLNKIDDKSNEVNTFTYQPVDPDAVKKVTIGDTDNVNGDNDNHVKVVKGQQLTFTLNGQKLPQYHEKVTSLAFEETFDQKLTYTGYKAFFKNNDGTYIDITDALKPVVDGQHVIWTANSALLAKMNSDEFNKVASWTPYILAFTKVNADGDKVTNTYRVLLNGKTAISNTTENPIVTVSPSKQVVNQSNKDINNTNITVNDILHYVVNWDLKDMSGVKLSDDLVKLAFGVEDDYDETKLNDLDSSLITVVTNNKGAIEDITNLVNITVNQKNGSFKITPKDTTAFLKRFSGQVLQINFYATPKHTLANGTKIENVATQINAGNKYQTNKVVNYVYQLVPKKDVVENIGNQKSLNQQAVTFDHVINYALTSSVRPTNYKMETTDWRFVDKLDNRDSFTGNIYVWSLTDLVDGNNKIPAKTLITKYFDKHYDNQTNTVTVYATDAWFDLLKKNTDRPVQFKVFVEAKRQGYGVIKNQFTEYYNNGKEQSNEIETVTYKPVDPPKPSKTITVGDVVDVNTPIDDNGKVLVTGDTTSYTLVGEKFTPYHEDIASVEYRDTLDSDLTFTGYDVYLKSVKDGKVVLTKVSDKDKESYLTFIQRGQDLTWVSTDKLETILNIGKYNEFDTYSPTIVVHSKVTGKGGAVADNVYTVTVNNKSGISNKVSNKIADFNPHKVVLNIDGVDINNGTVLKGQTVEYEGFIDLTDLANSKLSEAEFTKEWSFSDSYDKQHGVAQTSTLKVVDKDGKNVTNLFRPTWDLQHGTWKLTVANAKAFYNAYKGTSLKASFYYVVNNDVANGTRINNTMIQVVAGNIKNTNTVTNLVETSPIVIKVVKNNDGSDVNNTSVRKGQGIVYSGDWDLVGLANHAFTKEELAQNWTYSDDFDELRVNVNTSSLKVTDAKGNSVLGYITQTWDSKTGKWTLSPKDNKTFLDKYKGQKLHVSFNGTVKDQASGTIKNRLIQINGGKRFSSNEVQTPIVDNPTPVKVVENTDGTNINGTSVSRGQNVIYQGTWDLSKLANHIFTKEELAQDWSFNDDYDESRINANEESFKVTDDQGKDVTTLFNLNWDSKAGKWKADAKDLSKFLESYKGHKLTVEFTGVVTQDASGVLSNTMEQINGDKVFKTNTVTNNVEEPPTPVKVVTDLNGKDINNTDIQAGTKVVYEGTWDLSKLANHTFTNEELAQDWSFNDDYDESKLDVDQSTLKVTDEKGNDLLSLFDITWDSENGKLRINPSDKEAFLNAYKGHKLEVSFQAKVKDDAKGELTNTMEQINGGVVFKTNTVTNNVVPKPKPEEPTKPETPTQEVPPTPNKVVYQKENPNGTVTQAVLPTPEPKAVIHEPEALPQTSDTPTNPLTVIAGALAATLGLFGLGKSRRRED
ncbi:SspB-related isopeptide-forming adhesin [Ligilactobacillus agilis]|uniref:SspB-related isopeptide-forming adhesin n=1 Tax=Ligilactobacillus agilis TaxID=1601 RepID=UPI001B3B515D|nr:SspB-related isopeptide-forming adhesin [Ligilactobacillus agilis]